VILRICTVSCAASAAALCALACLGCGGGRGGSRGEAPTTSAAAAAPAAKTARHCAGVQRPVGTRTVAWAAVVVRPTIAYRVPGRGPIARFARLNVNRFPTVFSVVGERLGAECRAAWLHVELPIRPNGITGWINPANVHVEAVRTRILVDLSERRIRFYRRGRLVLSSRVAIGSPSTPTPTGRYYVNQRLLTGDPSGPYGPGAVGVSAFSNVLTGWAQGGPIGIHGTNEPWSIGHDVSNGCIRLPNPTLKMLFRQTPAGTPVIIRR
jgi:lipoprotein-anchoring transpeptidase ErfK/SrfK